MVDAWSIKQAVRVEPLAWWAVLPRAAVVAAGVLWVALLKVGVGDELGVAAVGVALSATRAGGEAIFAAVIVRPDGDVIAPLAALVL
jgi:hypothetical protein